MWDDKKVADLLCFPRRFPSMAAPPQSNADPYGGVRETRSKCIAKVSKNGYLGMIAMFLTRMARNLPHRLNPTFPAHVKEEFAKDEAKKKPFNTRSLSLLMFLLRRRTNFSKHLLRMSHLDSVFAQIFLKLRFLDSRSTSCAQISLRPRPGSCFLELRRVRHRAIANLCSGFTSAEVEAELRARGLHRMISALILHVRGLQHIVHPVLPTAPPLQRSSCVQDGTWKALLVATYALLLLLVTSTLAALFVASIQ